MAQKTLIGTALKMAVGFSYPADPLVTLDSMSDWQTEWYTSRPDKAVVLKKAGHIREVVTVGQVTTVSYYAVVDTTNLGPGRLHMRLKCGIPAGSDDRQEYAACETDVMVYER